MADLTLLRRSPLAHLADAMERGSGPALTLREQPFLSMVSVRVTPGTPAYDRMGAVLGLTLPAGVGETASYGENAVLWLGPDEWLVVSTIPAVVLVDDLVVALGDARGDAVDVSANRAVLELEGEAARSVLERGCPTDLHPRAFGSGRAVTTTLGPVPLLLWQTGGHTYRLLPRSSFADYTARWVLDAMREHVAASR